MTPTIWLSLVSTSVVISLTPGAGAINTMANSLSVGWRRSFWGVLGQQLALMAYLIIVAAGVGVFVANSPIMFNTIRYLGAAYLVYLGIRQLLARPTASTAPDKTEMEAVGASVGALILRGFWVNILNPKAVVFFLAFVPQFIKPDLPLVPQYTLLAVTLVAVDVLVMWGFFATAAKPFRGFAATPRGQRIIGLVFGVLFVLMGILLLFLH
ncbi:homoserine/homoserine lactone efflux protein [Leucobacter exalbidus]|uniref:Homoserine/homoserine lactone efflux protein n=1 Tax=Leucobacter exalbidus TaxID=662960 RepID=A0A940T1S5_9MICO|nr:homoserine/homoserine lactone efflux protein [Leucobacter exalbidus]